MAPTPARKSKRLQELDKKRQQDARANILASPALSAPNNTTVSNSGLLRPHLHHRASQASQRRPALIHAPSMGKRPLRINGKLSLPPELWIQVGEHAARNTDGIIVAAGWRWTNGVLVTPGLRRSVEKLLRPLARNMPLFDALKAIGAANEIIYPITHHSGYPFSPSPSCKFWWEKQSEILNPHIKNLHFLVVGSSPPTNLGVVDRTMQHALDTCGGVETITLQLRMTAMNNWVYSTTTTRDIYDLMVEGWELLMRLPAKDRILIMAADPQTPPAAVAPQSHPLTVREDEIVDLNDPELRGVEQRPVLSILAAAFYTHGSRLRRVAVRLGRPRTDQLGYLL